MQDKRDLAGLLTNGAIIPSVNGVYNNVSDTKFRWIESKNVFVLYDKTLNLVLLLRS